MCVRKADSFCVSANKTLSLDTIYVFIMKRRSLRLLLPFNLFFYTMRLITISVKKANLLTIADICIQLSAQVLGKKIHRYGPTLPEHPKLFIKLTSFFCLSPF